MLNMPSKHEILSCSNLISGGRLRPAKQKRYAEDAEDDGFEDDFDMDAAS